MIVIAHRGASAERPEHTRSAYELAIAQGCDFIEPDLVISRDGVLIVRHENEISGTTDVAGHPEFADRRRTRTIDDQALEGWFTEDFTLAELKTLRCRERLPGLRPQNTRFDGQDPILTFEELLDIAAAGRVGVYAELKHPTWFRALGLPLEEPVAAALERRGWLGADAPVILESFESRSVQRLKATTGCRTGQLIALEGRPHGGSEMTYEQMLAPRGLNRLRAWADAIGPDKAWLDRKPGLVADAHAAGLQVHCWTFRPENAFLPREFQRGADPAAHGDMAGELARAKALGVDAVFCDLPGAV
ncbi:MAG: glycerophosphodiester phosphodiesterase [Proteobacteria bacterium]|nr:glycerophosphodiester phosphodiesterase [Pseudomonadota bacterium]